MVVLSLAQQQLVEGHWRLKLDELLRRYQRDKDPETKAEFLLWLKQFTNDVLTGKL